MKQQRGLATCPWSHSQWMQIQGLYSAYLAQTSTLILSLALQMPWHFPQGPWKVQDGTFQSLLRSLLALELSDHRLLESCEEWKARVFFPRKYQVQRIRLNSWWSSQHALLNANSSWEAAFVFTLFNSQRIWASKRSYAQGHLAERVNYLATLIPNSDLPTMPPCLRGDGMYCVITGSHELGVSPVYVNWAWEELGCHLERSPILS